VEVDDEGAALVAGSIHMLRGPAAAGVTAADCKTVTVDMLATISTVRARSIFAHCAGHVASGRCHHSGRARARAEALARMTKIQTYFSAPGA
jgi:hypothetical protein